MSEKLVVRAILQYVETRLAEARENQKNPMFWSGHIEGRIAGLEDVRDFLKGFPG